MTAPPEFFAPQAIRDVEAAVDWFAERSNGEALARRFAGAVMEAAMRAVRRPLLGHRRLDVLPDPYRFARVRGFDYLLVYNAASEAVTVARVLHMRRDFPALLAELRDLATGCEN